MCEWCCQKQEANGWSESFQNDCLARHKVHAVAVPSETQEKKKEEKLAIFWFDTVMILIEVSHPKDGLTSGFIFLSLHIFPVMVTLIVLKFPQFMQAVPQRYETLENSRSTLFIWKVSAPKISISMKLPMDSDRHKTKK